MSSRLIGGPCRLLVPMEVAGSVGMLQASQGPLPGAGMWLSDNMPTFLNLGPCLKVRYDLQGGAEFWDRGELWDSLRNICKNDF